MPITMKQLVDALNGASADAREVLSKIKDIVVNKDNVTLEFYDGTRLTIPSLHILQDLQNTVNDLRNSIDDIVNNINDSFLNNISDIAILNKIKNVDGVGSGLDADLVRGLPADFTSSFASNGYQKLPSGLIIQWGVWQGTTPSDRKPVNVTFPIVFPNGIFSISLTPDDDATVHIGNEGVENVVAVHTKSNTGFSFMKQRVYGSGDGKEIYTVNWIAIGY